jgi:hypothetical protein
MRFKIFNNFLKNYEVNGNTTTLYDKVKELEEKYQNSLVDIKRLEEENIETTNLLYEIMNSVDAVDRRIDILDEHYQITKDV